jgi:hypothetical protein
MKTNLTLTGDIEVARYAYNPEGSLYPTRTIDHIFQPGRLTLAFTDEWFRANFWDYPSHWIDDDKPPSKEIHKLKFDLNSLFRPIEARTSVDNSGETWRIFNAKGGLEWLRNEQRFVEFSASAPINSNSLFIWAMWPQRPYPRAPKEMRSQSAILKLDDKSLGKWHAFWEEINGKAR